MLKFVEILNENGVFWRIFLRFYNISKSNMDYIKNLLFFRKSDELFRFLGVKYGRL